jgi:hypothetical protein
MEQSVSECWVSVNDIAAHHGVNKDTVHKWIRNQTIISVLMFCGEEKVVGVIF